ncbi:MAG: hypothetical protein A2W09_06460 [Deltaproteobacteria bacterium RBG_16_50_11]|nr:MAG: hypothetical protein A2W09_06460 [Deltaproteobacteria bacterium RBG_16_50_11]
MRLNRIFLFTFLLGFALSAANISLAANPWVISKPEIITTPRDVGDVIVVAGGSLTVQNVPEPGFRISGNLMVTDNGVADFNNSVIQVMSTYHGQYALLATGQGVIRITECDYRIPSGVQHALIAWENGRVDLQNSDFTFAQFVASGQATLTASQLNGRFECIVQDGAQMNLTDIPRVSGGGEVWVWPTFMPGSRATYTPPLPGFVPGYTFPPPGASGISQSFTIIRCNVMLWPMLVREGSDLTLQDIPPENWIVVGLHLPLSTTISGIQNGLYYNDTLLGLPDRTLRLQNASIDTWNLYPEKDAQVVIENSLVGEILASENSSVLVRNTTVDSSGGYFGVTDQATLEATNSIFACDVQISREASAILRDSALLPYPADPDGTFTHFGAHDTATLHLDRTPAQSTPSLGGKGVIAVTWITDPPPSPPTTRTPVVLHGYGAIYSLDTIAKRVVRNLKAYPAGSPWGRLLGWGMSIVEDGVLGKWQSAKPGTDYELVLTLKDGLRRTYTSRILIPAE